jgi:hypothetical protein
MITNRRQALYRPLPDSKGRLPDASFMVPRVRSYLTFHRDDFVVGMSKAISNAVINLQDMRHRTPLYDRDIVKVLHEIAEQRRDIAKNRTDQEDWDLFGAPIAELHGQRGPIDLIPDVDADRHYFYLERARDAYRKAARTVIATPGGDIPGSVILDDGQNGFVVQHPSKAACTTLMSIAYRIYAKLFEIPAHKECDFVKRIAEATYLLMHATPFIRGTPACVQALNDAVARVLIEKTFPNFKSQIEPFWEAIFVPQRDFSSAYREFFE